MDTEFREIPIGKGEILRQGDDVAIFAIGVTVSAALKAAEILAEKGIKATVVNARFAKPLDTELILALANRMKHFVTVEENVLNGGFGSHVNSLLQENNFCDIQIKSIGIPDEFVEHGTQAILREKYGLDAAGIARQVMRLLSPYAATTKG